jgi:hypothetical protein
VEIADAFHSAIVGGTALDLNVGDVDLHIRGESSEEASGGRRGRLKCSRGFVWRLVAFGWRAESRDCIPKAKCERALIRVAIAECANPTSEQLQREQLPGAVGSTE